MDVIGNWPRLVCMCVFVWILPEPKSVLNKERNKAEAHKSGAQTEILMHWEKL